VGNVFINKKILKLFLQQTILYSKFTLLLLIDLIFILIVAKNMH